MYRNEKKALIALCDSMHEAHEAIIKTGSIKEKTELCNMCQQCAIKIGESLEKEDASGFEETVHRLEEYCELVFRISGNEPSDEWVQDAGTEPEGGIESMAERLDVIVDEAAEAIEEIRPRLKIAFFPYKAEMWDSLESFYLAAREDPECDAYLVPIPYFEFDREKNEMVSRYDGARFPKDEDPIPFNRFDHRDGSIDIAYIHYPYDDSNLVTTVHPDYYSRELKKYVDKLVYAPYYVTAGFIEDGHLDFPVYENMDYAVFQSEDAKKCCKGRSYYDKILPFGSSKFDMIINKCQRGAGMPQEWRDVLGDRRILMLNTSINDLLHSNEAVIGKLSYFFDLIKNDDRLAVIWRPHPLLESTMRAMRPDLLESYGNLKKRFSDEGIGVFDTTPDISDTVAIADGYIGSSGSSVINLFAAAGKPVFIFNNTVREPVSHDDRRVLQLNGIECVRGRLYLKPYNMNAIFSVNLSNLSFPLKFEGSIPDVTDWTCSLYGLVRAGEKLYMAPYFADDAVCFDPVMGTVSRLGAIGRNYDVRFAGIGIPLPSRKSLFFLPANNKYLIMEYIPDRQKWMYHQESLAELHDGVARPNYIGLFLGGAAYNDLIWYSTGVCNRILKLEPGTGKYEILYLGKPEFTDELHFVLKGASKEGLWVGAGGSADLYLAPYDALSDMDKWRLYTMPEDYDFVHDDMGDPIGGTGSVYELGDDMIIFPYRNPHMMKMNKETGKISYLAEGFFDGTQEKGIGYELKFSSVIGAGCLLGTDRYVLQRMRDLHVAVIDLNDGSYEEFVPEIPSDLFEKLVPKDAGFFKGDTYDYFRMDESRLFPLENFLDVFARDGYAGVKERQKKELETLAANLDGTCGVKTHEYLKGTLM